jgi:hypothetical protein
MLVATSQLIMYSLWRIGATFVPATEQHMLMRAQRIGAHFILAHPTDQLVSGGV